MAVVFAVLLPAGARGPLLVSGELVQALAAPCNSSAYSLAGPEVCNHSPGRRDTQVGATVLVGHVLQMPPGFGSP